MAFKGGRNIAIKLPERSYADSLAFYKETLGLPVLSETLEGAVVDFGSIRLHLDRVPGQSQTDVWLQVETDDIAKAAAHLDAAGVRRCDEVETLPDGFQGFWIAAPAGTIHLIDGGSNG